MATDSSIMKTEALAWLRFGKKMPYVCTEGGYWNADCLGLSDDYAIEVEVKVSIADLKREFVTKTAKHFLYATAEERKETPAPAGTPNYFYFYVPKEIEEAALAIVKEKAPRAGLAVFEDVGSGWAQAGKKTSIAHRPVKLHDKKPSPGFKEVVLRRMGSELVGRYLVQQQFLNDILATMKAVDKSVIDVLKKMFQTPDFEAE